MHHIPQNQELCPSVLILFTLKQILDCEDLSIALYYLPKKNSKNLKVKHYSKGKFKDSFLVNKKTDAIPDREGSLTEFSVQNINELPRDIYLRFSKQQLSFYNQPDKSVKKIVFTLHIPSSIDGKWDFIYILITKGLMDRIQSNYSDVLGKPSLKTKSNQLILSYFNMTYPYLKEIVKISGHYTKQIEHHNSYISQLFTYNEILKTEKEKLKKSKKSEILKEFEEIIRNAEIDSNKRFILTEETKKFILDYKNGIDHLKASFYDAIEDLKPLDMGQTINIKPVHIELCIYRKNKGLDISTKRQERAADFLQRYEEAAQIAKNKGETINIKTIAAYVKPDKVSPPAISHSIKKYRNEIINLLHTKQESWKLLRTEFSPIKVLAKRFSNQV